MDKMCTSQKRAVDNSAVLAREQENQRQGRIAQGTTAIDNEFANYNDDFYNKYNTDYTNYYAPQLDDQYGKARERLTLQLAKTGNLTSSHGANKMGELKEYYGNQSTDIANKAMDATNALRGNIDNSKSQLYADNRAAADPGNAASMAAASARSLQPAQLNSPLADTFASFFNNAGNAAAVSNNSKPYQDTGVQTYNRGGSGSYKVYN